uniref:Uncharacterized protein n=1 Tax=Nothoprocta perdicaria TaxID=30464 RepID=A0A8C6YU05_NOTPE
MQKEKNLAPSVVIFLGSREVPSSGEASVPACSYLIAVIKTLPFVQLRPIVAQEISPTDQKISATAESNKKENRGVEMKTYANRRTPQTRELAFSYLCITSRRLRCWSSQYLQQSQVPWTLLYDAWRQTGTFRIRLDMCLEPPFLLPYRKEIKAPQGLEQLSQIYRAHQ